MRLGRVRGLGGEGVQPGDGGLWAIAGTSLSGGRAGWIRMVFTPVGGTEASWGRSSVRSTLVRPLRTQWLSPLCMLLILTLRTRPPRQGYATVTSVCCLRLNQVSNLPMRDLCVGCSVRSPGVVRRVGGLCPGGVRCGVSLCSCLWCWVRGGGSVDPKGGSCSHSVTNSQGQ